MHRNVPDSDLQYDLVSFDKKGRERSEADGLPSDMLATRLGDAAAPVTDVFMLSHGWKGDVPAAIAQCDAWIGQMGRMQADRAAIRVRRPGFLPMIVGLHWPSLPWGDESVASGSGSGLLSDETEVDTVRDADAQAKAYADVICDTPRGEALVRRILALAGQQSDASRLDPELAQAYQQLRQEAGLDADQDLLGDGGSAADAWNPQAIFQQEAEEGSRLLGDGNLADALLSPLRQLSFWRMKDRARDVGERGVSGLLRKLQDAAPAGTRFHVMGHSFGCIVVSSAIAGERGAAPPRPVHSALLVQGALSLWSYCPDIDGEPGYFHRIVDKKLVRGPIVTTRSKHDRAVGRYYPMGAGIAGQRTLADLPKYGGAGSFGLQGLGDLARDAAIGSDTTDYGLVAGKVHNIEASPVIRQGGGASGAHSDIAHPEVAHLAWQAIMAGA